MSGRMPTTASAQRRTVVLPEYQRAVVECSAETARRMHADGHVMVAPSDVPGAYEVRARHKVGVLRYGSLELRIVPKVSVTRLLYLATFHENDAAWRQLETMLDEVDDPYSAIAHALAFHAERALRPTPLQGYVTHEEAEMRLRGRVLFDRQIAKRAGVQLPAELRYDEYELGIAENRVLKAALLVVVRFVQEPALGARLRHLIAQLDVVEPWRIGQAVPQFTFGRLNERYRSALALARLVLDRRSLDYPAARRRGTAFLFNMNRVFESYLEAALRASLGLRGGRIEGQYSTALDVGERLKMRPDITWWRSGRCAAVLDAKYKRTTNTEYPNADAYQMLAYCTRLGLQLGFLVYADLGGTEPRTSVIRNADIEIVVTSVDIGGSIPQLQASVEALAVRVAQASDQRVDLAP